MYVRIGGISPSQAAESASALFGDCAEVPGTPEGKTEFVTPAAPDGVLRQRLARMPGVTESAIRLL